MKFANKVNTMITFPSAKINIGLSIVKKRDDGFHNIESVFYPIPVNDVLEITLKENNAKATFINSGYIVDSPIDSNLCIKAFRLMQGEFNIPDLHIHLHKVIPFGAGLGGGSSDAAYTIKAINGLFNLQLSIARMKEIAAKIGSDCSFFIENVPSLAKGRGEILKPINLDLKGWCLVLVKPEIHISTAMAYSEATPKKPGFDLENIVTLSVDEWKENIINDFEQHIFIKFPRLQEIKGKLYSLGAAYASMSGSGSTIYSLFKEEVDLRNMFSGCYVFKKLLQTPNS
jgi:4-diphosphocytidyl-2-C-methyl-D-erythritol kinase